MANADFNDGLRSEVRQKIIGLLSTLFPQAKIYLFGSRATGNFQRTSDIDIAIDAGHRLPIENIDEANAVMQSLNIVYKVDVVDFYGVPEAIKNSIIKDNVVWKN
jgi:predicted nucleotidyltransferase